MTTESKGTVEAIFRWMTQRFERRMPNTSYGVHDAEAAALAGGLTLEALERAFFQAIVDDYQQAWDPLRRQRRSVLWEQAVAETGVPRYLGTPDDLKLLLMKAVNRKRAGGRYQVQAGARLSFQGRWYVCPGLLSRLQGREFELYYDRRDISVVYLFVEGRYLGEAYCTELMGRRVSEWESLVMRQHDKREAAQAALEGRQARARTQQEASASRKQRKGTLRQQEQSRQWDRQREEIHPAGALERLQEQHPPPPERVPLAKAVPDAEPDRPVRALRVRPKREEPWP